MRKFIVFICLASAMTLAGCSEKNTLEKRSAYDGDVLEITVAVPELSVDDGTKSNLVDGKTFSWSTNDQLGFIPYASSYTEFDRQSMFYIPDASTGNFDASPVNFKANGWGLIRGKKYYSYYPYSSTNSCTSVSVDYTGQTQATNGGSAHLGAKDYLHTSATMPATGTVSMQYRRIGCTAKITVTVPDDYASAVFTKMTLSSSGADFLSSGTYNPSVDYPITENDNKVNKNNAETVTFSSSNMSDTFVLNLDSLTPDGEKELVLYAMMSPTAWNAKTITLTLDGTSGGEAVQLTGTFTPKKNQLAGVCYTYSSSVSVPPTFIDLSADGTANCYVVTGPGTYRFRADVKGNGVAVSTEGSALGTANCAYLLWETVNTETAPARNSIVTNVEYKTVDDVPYVYFDVPKGGVPGNALIALLSSAPTSGTPGEGNTIWAWHIWHPQSAPTVDVYSDNVKFMNMNLGALNNTREDPLAIGLLYQWGRFYPMLGATTYTYPGAAQASTTAKAMININQVLQSNEIPTRDAGAGLAFGLGIFIQYPLPYLQGGITQYDDTKPTQIVTYRKMTSDVDNRLLWSTSKKTQYDPCPPGYRVPVIFSGFALDGSLNEYGGYVKYSSDGGTTYGSKFWWPMTGMRGLYVNHYLTNTGYDSTYWSSSWGKLTSKDNTGAVVFSTDVGYGMNFSNAKNFNNGGASFMISGNPVRCQKQ